MIDLGNRELEKLVENCIASKKVHGIQMCRLDTNIGALCVDCISNGDCELCKRYFQTGSEVGVAFDVAMKSMKKLGEIEQILKARSFTDDIGNACYLDDSERIGRIKEVLESEDKE